MFCPTCKDEFRAGFTRCASCDVDLVDSLSGSGVPEAPRPVQGGSTRPAVARMVDYCGFFSLDDARDARRKLKAAGILTEISIRDIPGIDDDDEEYWLRVERDRYREVFTLLGFDEHDHNAYDDTFSCAECGHEVAAAESFCPKCGARFEDD